MGLIQLLTNRRPQTSGPVQSIIRLGRTSYNATAWGFTRVANSVLGNPTAARCIELRMYNSSRPDFIVRRRKGGDAIDTHPILDVLNRPSPTMTGTMMQRLRTRDMIISGRSLWLKTYGQDGMGKPSGPPIGLRRMAPQRTTVFGDSDDNLLGFLYVDRMGRRALMLPEDVVYHRYPHPEREFDGLAPAITAGLPAETDNIAQRFNFDLLSNDTALPGYLVVDGLSADQFGEFKMAWEQREYPGKTRILGNQGSGANGQQKVTYVQVGQTNQELTYHELRQDSQQDICRALAVSKLLIDPTDATYANMAEARSSFWVDTILPDLGYERDEWTLQLGCDFGGILVDFDLDDIDELQEAQSEIVDRGVKLINERAITINEWREQLNMPPLAWGDDEPGAPMKVTPIPLIPPGTPGGQPALNAPPPPVPSPVPPKADAELDIAEELERFRASIRVLDPAVERAAISERHAAAYREWDRRVQAFEARASRRLGAFLAKQGRVIEERLKRERGKSTARLTAAQESAPWWDQQRWDGELADEVETVLGDVVDAFGTHTLARLRPAFPDPAAPGTVPDERPLHPIAFDPSANAVRSWITNRSTEVAGLVNGTTESDVRSTLADVESQGGSVSDMITALRGYFADRGPQRAEVFARTEVVGAANFGTLQGASQSGVATHKQWMTAADDRVDADCEALDGEEVALEDAFSSGDDQPPAHPDCRCTVLIDTPEGY